MLQSLHVKNLALIDEAEVEFQKGLNILTGETGAGKSIILGSVNLALGGRYTADFIRKGAAYGFVELVFTVEEENLKKKLMELDIFLEENQLILSRRLMEGRSVSKINGETVSIGQLKEISALLIDIHGQHEHQSLLYKKNHLTILDTYGKAEIGEACEKVSKDYHVYKEVLQKLEEASMDEAGRQRELSLLEYETTEIQNASLRGGEDTELEKQHRIMVHARKIVEASEETYGYTCGDTMQNASDLLSRGIRSLNEVVNYDEALVGMQEQLNQVDALLNDFNRELSDYIKTVEFSEEDYQTTEERLNEINRLKTKYGNTVEDILLYCQEKEERMVVLTNFDHYKEQLKEKAEEAFQQLSKSSDKLSKLRRKYAKILEKEIQKGISELNFLETQFQICVKPSERMTANGNDDVEFLVSMNPGEPVRPLGDVASGGELSRIMLAVKTAMADKDEIPTLIFDEIDVGISGRTAQKVSEKMSLIGKERQVICITHLAQIAAMADAHYVIEKQVKDGNTKTSIHLLNEKDSIQELARILGGAEITDKVVESAVEMKQLAIRTK